MAKKSKPRPQPESLRLPLVGIDTHAHLDLEHFKEDQLDEVFAAARRAGVSRIGNVFLGPQAYDLNRERFTGRPEVFFLMAVHPNDTAAFSPTDIELMRERFQADDRLKAIGETGLDYYWKRVPEAVQKAAFRAHLDLARELKLPVVIHSRDADEDTMTLLVEEGFKDRPVLWHCFGGSPEMAAAVLNNGWHISIPGPVTYAANEALRRAIPLIPLNRLVIETDSPYLTPEPWRGKQNHPALVAFTAAKIAEVKAMEPAELWRATARTAREFFRLD
ncbi:MAG: TatD family hydrolase [Proteobacteria bacterium]|nr:TatD family hydrolase [Pseudomonadota bacterium]MBU1610372.1 TatD family hydrolase [Pseudomonadota bacterium]